MCGISGHLGVSADPELIDRLSRCAHAASGPASGPPAVARVGTAVLAVTAPGDAAGRALATSVSGRHTLVLDGELYEADQLREDLVTLGHDLTGGDAAVALAAYGEWGPEGLDRLEGSFALAVHDRETDAVTLARDPFGTRQLYVARVPGEGGWLFSSTIRPILESGHHERRPDDRTIYRYLCFRVHDDGPETFFAGIERVGAGETLTLTPGGAERHVWSSLRDELEATRGAKPYGVRVVEDFRHLLTAAVRRASTRVGSRPRSRVASTRPPSCPSSTVVGTRRRSDGRTTCSRRGRCSSPTRAPTRALRRRRRRLPSATASRPTGSSRPRPSSRTTCATSCAPRRSRSSRPAPTRSTASAGGRAETRPTVLLDGHGGDETLGGFGPHHLIHLRELRSRGAVGERRRRARPLARRALPTGAAARRRPAARSQGRAGDVAARPRLRRATTPPRRYDVERADLRARLVDDVFAGSLPARLRYTDKNARRFGVAVRLPFVDRDLVRFVFGLSDDALVKDGVGKRVLRDAMRGCCPTRSSTAATRSARRPRRASGSCASRTTSTASSSPSPSRTGPTSTRRAVLHAFEGWIKGTNSIDSMTVWRMLNLELWLQEFFDEHEPEDAGRPRTSRPTTSRTPASSSTS